MTRKDSSMSTTEPKAGEWWWVEIADGGRRRPAEVVIEPRTGRLCWEMDGRLVNARPIARIPDPPAPDPTEAEKIDARRAAVIDNWMNEFAPGSSTRDCARMIRASDESAGYVLVPTEGPGFEVMVSAAKEACPIILTDRFGKALRAALSAAKGDAR